MSLIKINTRLWSRLRQEKLWKRVPEKKTRSSHRENPRGNAAPVAERSRPLTDTVLLTRRVRSELQRTIAPRLAPTQYLGPIVVLVFYRRGDHPRRTPASGGDLPPTTPHQPPEGNSGTSTSRHRRCSTQCSSLNIETQNKSALEWERGVLLPVEVAPRDGVEESGTLSTVEK